MKFGEIQLGEAVGCVLALALLDGTHRLKKGTLLNTQHVEQIKTAGVMHVMVVHLEYGDIYGGAAAFHVTQNFEHNSLKAVPSSSGRVNIHSPENGLLLVNKEINAGGHVLPVGMPVDPDNLIVLGALNHLPIIEALGCAHSTKENGFDWSSNSILAVSCMTWILPR